MSIISTEIHVVHSPEEAELLRIAGLPAITTEKSCANCSTPVGCVEGKFIPLAVALNHSKDWVTCLRCASPLLFPRE